MLLVRFLLRSSHQLARSTLRGVALGSWVATPYQRILTLLRKAILSMSEQAIRLMCPNLTCRRILTVPFTARGKVVRCPGCGRNVRVPTATGSVGKVSSQATAVNQEDTSGNGATATGGGQ